MPVLAPTRSVAVESLNGSLNAMLDALGDAGGALVVAAVEQDRELVAAQPRGQVAGAQAGRAGGG